MADPARTGWVGSAGSTASGYRAESRNMAGSGDPNRNEPGVAAIVWGEVWVELVCCPLIRLK